MADVKTQGWDVVKSNGTTIGAVGNISSEDELDGLFEMDDEITPDPVTPETPAPTVVAPQNVPQRTPTKTVNSEDEFEETFGEDATEELPDEIKPVSQESPAAEEPKPTTIDSIFLRAKAEEKAKIYGIELEDGIEWDDETYMQFELALDDKRLEEKYGQLKSTSPEIEALLEVAENEGNISSLIETFGQRRELAQIDTSTPEGKIEKIRKYYKEVEGKSPEWTSKYIKRLQISDEESDLDDELNDVNEKYDKHFAAETQRKVAQAEAVRIEKERKVTAQKNNFVSTLKTQEYKDNEIAKLSSYVYNDKAFKDDRTGETFSAFDVAIIRAKADPAKLAELVQFLSEPEKFKEKITQAKTNSVVNSKFKKIVDTASGVTPSASSTKPTPVKTGFKFNIS